MLVKDTKGRVLTDVHGVPMTTKDRWHPLVVSFVKRVIADGGEIISPAIEEMNQMAWEGKFDDALYVYFAGARKVGKTYALIPNDGSGDLDVERDSVAWEWEKYRTLDEIVNDMPEMAFDPLIGEFLGIKKKPQNTNYYNRNSNHNWDTDAGTGTIPTVIQSDKNIFGVDINVVQVIKTVGDGSKIVRFADFTIPSSSTLDFGFFFKVNSFSNPISATPNIKIRPGQNSGNGDYYLKIYELPIGEWVWLYDGHPSLITVNKFNSIFADRTTINCWFNTGNNDYSNPNTDTVLDIEIGSLNITAEPSTDPTDLIYTDGSAATRLADDIEDIAVPMGATEIRAFVDGVETVIDSDLPATWEFPENSTTKYVIIK